MITVIETKYKGYSFRSRLEARWAVFFDKLGIDWEYESEGYKLSDGSYYLPDFWLPTFSGGMFAEVKPLGGDFSKAEQLCWDAKKPVWLCEGVPEIKEYEIYEYNTYGSDPRVTLTSGIPNSDSAEGENRMFWQAGYDPQSEDMWGYYGQSKLAFAVRAAKSTHFKNDQ